MGVAPNFGAEVNGREDGGSIYPDVVKDVGTERGDKGKGVGVKVQDAGDVAEEVSVDELLLWNPEFLATVIDNGVLVRVAVDYKSTGRGSEEVGEDVG